jgi:ribosome-associated toxin RatA of RatAB toxin-antitoxin module
MSMPTVEVTTEIEAPDAVVFDLSQDYRLRPDWDPFVRALRFEDGARAAAIGVRTWVRAKNGLSMTVEYVTFDRPRRVAMRMVSRSILFERFAGTWLFEQRSPMRTHVTFRYGFEPRWGAMRPLLERVIVRTLTRDMRARLAGLKRGAEDPAIVARIGSREPVRNS